MAVNFTLGRFPQSGELAKAGARQLRVYVTQRGCSAQAN